MAVPQQGGGGQSDNSLGPLWAMVGIFVATWLIWAAWHAEIVKVYFKLKQVEIALVSFFTDSLDWLHTMLDNVDYASISFMQAVDVSAAVGEYLRYPVVIILAIFALVLYFLNVNSRFCRSYSMKSLIEEEKANWPHVMPIVKPDIQNADIHKGPWAMSMTPLDFARKHGLIDKKEQLIMDRLRGKKTLIEINKAKAHSIFAMQMGPVWQGIEKLNDHTRGLFTMFAACAMHDRDTANDLIDQFAVGATAGKIDVSNCNKLLAKYVKEKVIGRIVHSHAYVYTIMASMIELARTDGVLASADFIWLKTKERNLWYMLNTIGRQTPFTESAGPFAHWLAEKELRRKIYTPMVDQAVEGLAVALTEVLFVPNDEEERLVTEQA